MRGRPVASVTARATVSLASDPEWPSQTRLSLPPGVIDEQLLRKPHRRLARRRQDACRRHVRERRVNRLAHRRMAMPEARRAPGGGEVEDPAPVGLDQMGTFATVHRQRKEAQVLHSRQRLTITVVERFCH